MAAAAPPASPALTPNAIVKQQNKWQRTDSGDYFIHTWNIGVYLLTHQRKASTDGVVTGEALELCLNTQNMPVHILLDLKTELEISGS